MATEKTQTRTVTVRALVDLPAYGALCGQLAQVPSKVFLALKADGLVDDHKDAIAYARNLAVTATTADAGVVLDA